MKVISAGIILVVVVGVGLLALREHDRRVRETAAATRSMDSLRLAVARERAERAARYTADSLASLRAIQAQGAALAAARRAADSLTGVAGVLVDSLEAVLPDSLGDFSRRVRAAWRAEQEAWQAERAAVDTTIAAYVARITQLETSYATDLAAVNRQLDESLRQLDAALRRTNPGLPTRVLRVVPWVGGAYIVGRLSR